jgi:type I restriction enzyme M protein
LRLSGGCGRVLAQAPSCAAALLRDKKQNAHFHQRMFHGYDFDNTMLRIGSMNTLLHGVENPAIA